MKQKHLAAIAGVSVTLAIGTVFTTHIVHGQSQPPTTIYNPYPTGILPTDIVSELARVEREVDFIEAEAITQWKAIPPPTLTGNPPILQGTGVQSVEVLGKLMNFDKTISPFNNVACASCHMPYAGFSGPIPSVNLTMIAYPGSVHFRAGKRTAQRYTYSSYFPPLQFNELEDAFFGGNFWDSRATGYLLRSTDAEQSQFPPVDPAEMGNPDTACITYKLSLAPYRPLFELIWGAGSFDITWPANIAQICATPNGAASLGGSATPVMLSPSDRTRSNADYDHWAQSLSAFEKSLSVSPFTSKFDAFLAGDYTLTPEEQAGYDLFRGRGNCNSCHLDGRSTAPAPTVKHGGTAGMTGGRDTGAIADTTPVFTCFGSANLGLPKNPRDAFYFENTPDFFGFTLNPTGFSYTDLGLGAFLRSGFGSAPNPNSTWTQFASVSDGKMQTSTARDVALVPPQCPTTEAPGPYFQKEFFHNGYIKSLKQLVHFYNTRDVYKQSVSSGNCPAGTVEKVNCWPSPEVPQNLDMTVGHLGLTDVEENQIVTFLQTLTDGFTTPYPDINTFTGACMTGGTAATQGNSTIISAERMQQLMQQIR
ncbi:MAG TPA: cytochrome c peroxidase [Edaphobacter sp.]|nr:cytochrome c peroxidase [Edaphobacter sp.]